MTDGCAPCRRNSTFPIIAIGLAAVAIAAGWAIGKFRGDRNEKPSAQPALVNASARAEVLFQANCASCHGPDGRGDGTTAATLRPPPRDFSARPWRYEVTKPTICNVILNGVPGTAMVAARNALSSADVDLLVDHVYALATSRPTITHQPSPEEKLLSDARFVDCVGIETPPLNAIDAKGQSVKLADFKGRLVLVNFWGTNCLHCLKEMPHLRNLETEYAKRGLTVLHVCADEDDAKAAQDALDGSASGLRALVESSGIGLARFEAQLLPTFWLIGADGRAIGRASGVKDWRSPELRKLIEHWLPQ